VKNGRFLYTDFLLTQISIDFSNTCDKIRPLCQERGNHIIIKKTKDTEEGDLPVRRGSDGGNRCEVSWRGEPDGILLQKQSGSNKNMRYSK
jgi:hypothetical protein